MNLSPRSANSALQIAAYRTEYIGEVFAAQAAVPCIKAAASVTGTVITDAGRTFIIPLTSVGGTEIKAARVTYFKAACGRTDAGALNDNAPKVFAHDF